MSICYFTLATEIRFLEMEDLKKQQFTNKYKQQNSQEQKLRISEVYHLKAIEIACKFVACKSPYIDHLVQSYHKHYYNSLEIIQVIPPSRNFTHTDARPHTQVFTRAQMLAHTHRPARPHTDALPGPRFGGLHRPRFYSEIPPY